MISLLTFACLHAVTPRVIEFRVACISTVPEPAATATTTTAFAGLVSTALGAHGGRHRGNQLGVFTVTIMQVVNVSEALALGETGGALFRLAFAVASRVHARPGTIHHRTARFLREARTCGLAEAAVSCETFAGLRLGVVVASVARVAGTL